MLKLVPQLLQWLSLRKHIRLTTATFEILCTLAFTQVWHTTFVVPVWAFITLDPQHLFTTTIRRIHKSAFNARRPFLTVCIHWLHIVKVVVTAALDHYLKRVHLVHVAVTSTNYVNIRGCFRPDVLSARFRLFIRSCVKLSWRRGGSQSNPTAASAALTW